MQSSASSTVTWQRRTNRLIATAVVIIGLTMMISNIAQCIYIGMAFIVVALIWLARMAVNDRKVEPPRPTVHSSPVLFLVTSHMLPRSSGTRFSNPNDKPPSYDQILSLDGLPPDYNSVVTEKLPQYNEATGACGGLSTSSVTVTIESPPAESNCGENESKNSSNEEKAIGCVGGARPKTSNSPDQNSRQGSSLWNTFTRGISMTSSFSLPSRASTNNRKRHFSSTSSSAESCIQRPENVGCSLVKLQVPTLQRDVIHNSTYLNSSFDTNSDSIDLPKVHSSQNPEESEINNIESTEENEVHKQEYIQASSSRSILASSSSSDCFIDATAVKDSI